MFNYTSSPTWNFTFRRDLSAKSLYLLCAFSKLAFANSQRRRAASPHQVVWPLALPHLHHSRVILVMHKSWAQLVTCSSPFGMGWTELRSVSSCCNKTRLTPSGPPNLVDPSPHNSLGIVGSPSSPSWFVHRFGGGKKCSSWVSTPFTSTRATKTYSWTSGLDPTLCPLEGHDAWKCGRRTTFSSLEPFAENVVHESAKCGGYWWAQRASPRIHMNHTLCDKRSFLRPLPRSLFCNTPNVNQFY